MNESVWRMLGALVLFFLNLALQFRAMHLSSVILRQVNEHRSADQQFPFAGLGYRQQEVFRLHKQLYPASRLVSAMYKSAGAGFLAMLAAGFLVWPLLDSVEWR